MVKVISNWFNLLRVPNLFSAPGDALAGLFLAQTLTASQLPPTPRTLALLSAASLLAYAFGILTNDLFDLKEDRRFRPERPLPSGRISVGAAILAALLTAAGSLCCAFCIQAATPRVWHADALLLFVILVYNGGAKRLRAFGSLVMGLCRGCNVLLGLAACQAYSLRPAVPSDLHVILPALLPAVAVTIAITAVTWIADGENRVQRIGGIAFAPAVAAFVSWLAVLLWMPWMRMLSTGVFGMSLLFIAYAVGIWFFAGLALYHNDAPPALTRPAIGAFIRTLLPWQIAWILLGCSLTSAITAAALCAAWLLARKLAKCFPQT